MPGDLSAEAWDLYGNDFVTFVLNGALPSQLPDDDLAKRQVVETLERIAVQAVSIGDPSTRHRVLLNMLSDLVDGGSPLPIWLRQLSGGEMPGLPEGDEPSRILTELALAAFPFRLLKVRSNDPFARIQANTAIYRHAAFDSFASAVLQDVTLRELFPDPVGAPEGKESHQSGFPYAVGANLIWSSGSGGTLSLGALASGALDFTFAQMLLSGSFELNEVPSFVQATVGLMRKLAGGKRRAMVPVVVSLANLSVEPGLIASVGTCRLLAADAVRGRVLSVDQQTSAVLVLNVELRLLDVVALDPSDDGSDPAGDAFQKRVNHRSRTIEAQNQALDREVMRARLAIALASQDDALLAPTFRARHVLNPLSGGGGAWTFNPYPSSITPPAHVDASVAEALGEWGERVRAHPDSLWMGARRLLSAMTDRREALDAFIDAVICWENLLGSETEVTFRVSAGLATLLESEDLADRLVLFNELRDLYKVRSGLVHGSHEPPAAESHRHAQRAIRVAIDAMQAIYYRPELLDAPSSVARNRRLLLGA